MFNMSVRDAQNVSRTMLQLSYEIHAIKKNAESCAFYIDRQMSQNTQTRINQTNEGLSNGRRSQINLYEGRTEGSISLAPASIRQSSIRSAFKEASKMLDPVLLKG